MTFNEPMYLVIEAFRGTTPFFREVDLDRTSLGTVCKDLRDGQYRDVLAVIEIDIANHTSREATHEFAPLLQDHRDPD
jgi:hypothetical protein